METTRVQRTDHRLQRRALLRDVREGLRSLDDVRDAHPDLVRAGVHVGAAVAGPCPLCAQDRLRHVSYAFEPHGTRGGSGRALPADALQRYANRHGDLAVYVVEVCVGCRWHHLVESYRLLAEGSAVG